MAKVGIATTNGEDADTGRFSKTRQQPGISSSGQSINNRLQMTDLMVAAKADHRLAVHSPERCKTLPCGKACDNNLAHVQSAY